MLNAQPRPPGLILSLGRKPIPDLLFLYGVQDRDLTIQRTTVVSVKASIACSIVIRHILTARWHSS